MRILGLIIAVLWIISALLAIGDGNITLALLSLVLARLEIMEIDRHGR